MNEKTVVFGTSRDCHVAMHTKKKQFKEWLFMTTICRSSSSGNPYVISSVLIVKMQHIYSVGLDKMLCQGSDKRLT